MNTNKTLEVCGDWVGDGAEGIFITFNLNNKIIERRNIFFYIQYHAHRESEKKVPTFYQTVTKVKWEKRTKKMFCWFNESCAQYMDIFEGENKEWKISRLRWNIKWMIPIPCRNIVLIREMGENKEQCICTEIFKLHFIYFFLFIFANETRASTCCHAQCWQFKNSTSFLDASLSSLFSLISHQCKVRILRPSFIRLLSDVRGIW